MRKRKPVNKYNLQGELIETYPSTIEAALSVPIRLEGIRYAIENGDVVRKLWRFEYNKCEYYVRGEI
jgi:hypothetical protein